MTKIERRAYVVVCDDVLFGLTGKAFLQGVYTSDITLPSNDELIIPQLVFYFSAETPKKNPFKKMALRVTPPSMPPAVVEIPIETMPQANNPHRPKMLVRAPVLLQQVRLRPGKIETTVVTESEELDAGGIWITSTANLALPR
ncbi:hypothetical protein NLM33_35805 [Bradyrhizobium sp. CCGUVB1N3]|uniref:hypothetical protein n=1 Tax=Bradyrhizobium sp. CCGUVB1N3 TaxID=2949629 RepID=UPI0020B42CD7|nr:hypothetical protein [Bradyrhizobium sp. CCGUVB1N3]MCP3475641.1 hypothetical protein [Bradyrhizobium sp. CCGUVB1N3]